jgi:hypothetical protein
MAPFAMCEEFEAPGLGGLDPPPAFNGGVAGAGVNFSFKLFDLTISHF